MGGPGGRKRPLRASRDRRRPQAVPVATKEATGIDSRDKGVSFPPEKQFTTPKKSAGEGNLSGATSLCFVQG